MRVLRPALRGERTHSQVPCQRMEPVVPGAFGDPFFRAAVPREPFPVPRRVLTAVGHGCDERREARFTCST